MNVFPIFAGTALAGVGSVLAAALISPRGSSKHVPLMLSFAAGALLSTALTHLLPEATEGDVPSRSVFITLLLGVISFFLLDKVELWHHGHEHHESASGHVAGHRTGGSWAVLVGDGVHCFGDGLLIASAFIADMKLGVLASLAVLCHEIPHHLGDFAVLRSGGSSARSALLKVVIAGGLTVCGGLVGAWLATDLKPYLPYFLAIAGSSFVYVALADLIPQLQRHASVKQSLQQVLWLLLGVGVVWIAGTFDID